MRAAALDISSMTGFAVWDGVAAAPTLGRKRVIDWDFHTGRMLEGWRDWLGRFIAEHQPEVFAIEGAAAGTHGDIVTMDKQAMLRGFVLWACHVKQIPIYAFPPSSWRKTYIGFGKRRDGMPDWKALCLRRTRHLGWECPDHNAADAGGVLDHLLTTQLRHPAPWRADPRNFLPLSEI